MRGGREGKVGEDVIQTTSINQTIWEVYYVCAVNDVLTIPC